MVLVDGIGIAAIVVVDAGAAVVVVVSIEVDIEDAVVVDGGTVVIDASPVGVGLDVIVATACCSAAVPHAESTTPSSVTSTRRALGFIVVTVPTGEHRGGRPFQS
jgi:hypothetical protein